MLGGVDFTLLLVLKGEIRPPRLGKMLHRQPPESYSEIWAIESVDEWIYSRIDPTQPGQVAHDERVGFVYRKGRR